MHSIPYAPLSPTPFGELGAMEWVAPVLPALAFMAVLSLVPEPQRQRFNAVFVGGAGAAYLGGGFGLWELAFTAAATAVAYLGLRSYSAIGWAWLMHTAWDLVHHSWGHPILPTLAASSIGCAICDVVLAAWFFFNAPSLLPLRRLSATCRQRARRRCSGGSP